jgi:outer membrane protein TolC
MQSRYRAGLDDYAEFIQAQYDLLNAEVRLKIKCGPTAQPRFP